MKPPRKHKRDDELTVEEHVERLQAERRGESAQFETDEHRRYRAEVLRAGGLKDEADELERTEPELEDMSPDEHYRRLRRGPR